MHKLLDGSMCIENIIKNVYLLKKWQHYFLKKPFRAHTKTGKKQIDKVFHNENHDTFRDDIRTAHVLQRRRMRLATEKRLFERTPRASY